MRCECFECSEGGEQIESIPIANDDVRIISQSVCY